MSDLEIFITTIAQKLGEPDPGVVAQIRAVVKQIGPEKVAVLVRAVAQIEQLGGCLVLNGTRKRTPGGLFLVFARGCMTRAQRVAIWGEMQPDMAKAAGDESAASTQSSGTGGTVEPDKTIVPPKLNAVNTTAERRYNAKPYPTPH